MDLHLGPHLPGYGEQSRIRYDQGIRPLGRHISQFRKILFRPLQVPVVGQDIGSHIDPDAPGMGKGNPLCHLLHGKIPGFGPQAECLTPDIYRVCAKYHRRPQHLQTGGRDQQFRFLTFHIFLLMEIL